MRQTAGLLAAVIVLLLSACQMGSSGVRPSATVSPPQTRINSVTNVQQRVLLDFEQPNPPVVWEEMGSDLSAAGGTAAKGADAQKGVEVLLTRSSVRPNSGLWALEAGLEKGVRGAVVHKLGKPEDWQRWDTFTVAITHLGTAAESGQVMAAPFLVDAEGHRVRGDFCPVTTRWQTLRLDLAMAAEEGLDLSQVAVLGLELPALEGGAGAMRPETVATGPVAPPTGRPTTGPAGDDAATTLPGEVSKGLLVQMDTWAVETNRRAYLEQSIGMPRGFYVERVGERLKVGMAERYEITFLQRTGTERAWLRVMQGKGKEKRLVLGQPGTGVMILDQNGYDGLAAGMQEGPYKRGSRPAGAGRGKMPGYAWPCAGSEAGGGGGAGLTSWSWECVWTSAVGALVEVKETVGPFDALGRPLTVVTWRFMVYQWGQVFVNVSWDSELGIVNSEKGAARLAEPVSWALVLDSSVLGAEEGVGAKGGDPERLLAEIYPKSVREAVARGGTLPHQMQAGAPVAMIAKTMGGGVAGGAEKNVWWWAETAAPAGKKVFGVGIGGKEGPGGRNGPLNCMLLVNGPTALAQAGSFGQYLVPPRIKVRQGELDRNFPGDLDNDGLVDSYGFEVVRLSRGRASFVVDPEGRPLFYPPVLFTVPAVEREAVDLKGSRVLINIDGQQFADPPQWPDGSFLLQLPWVIDRPVGVEAILVRK